MEIALYPRTDGLLEPRNDRALEWVKKQDCGLVILATINADTRTTLQQRYQWGWVYKNACEMLNDAGHTINGFIFTKDRLHAMCQQLFLVIGEIPLGDGRVAYEYESTASMSKKRFSEFINEQVKPWLIQDYEIYLPEPEDGFYRELARDLFGKRARRMR